MQGFPGTNHVNVRGAHAGCLEGPRIVVGASGVDTWEAVARVQLVLNTNLKSINFFKSWQVLLTNESTLLNPPA